MGKTKGGFTLPGEAGYEKLTLELAEKWGADVIRDSDGTELSDEITGAGYGIYSTICIIRDHNEWAQKHMDKLQQTFLITAPVTAVSEEVCIDLLAGFFEEQFAVNDSPEALAYYQVYDRTIEQEVQTEDWEYCKADKTVVIKNCVKWHKYTVSFLAYRIWEEISMYNHVTNSWEKEHLMPLDPCYPEVQNYMREWLDRWCKEHPATTVVRFTSMFYNFVWIWGGSERNRNLFTDWGSYDFTVSPLALKLFEQEYGYAMQAEDFVNQGKYQVTHMPPSSKKRDWMAFINQFVVQAGKQLVDIVHRYGKKAYIFYDDSWIGTEPYSKRFKEFQFDGMIKCVFSGYEVRLCAGVPSEIHEIRLHPYLFPTGLGGAPTFMEGGDPLADAQQYWRNIRRALLWVPIQRIGLGGYLHLVKAYPEFCDYIEQLADEFRTIKACHEQGRPYRLKASVAVLHQWGNLRPWTLSGHFHETEEHDLIHLIEALAGLPVQVDFIDFDTVRKNQLDKYQIIINAGSAGSAWSGGEVWKEAKVIENLTEWVYHGGCFLGVNEPSAVSGYDTFFRMAHVLGIDIDTGARVCHGRWQYELQNNAVPGIELPEKSKLYLTDGKAEVFAESEKGIPQCTQNSFGAGRGIYLSGFRYSDSSTRYLLDLILTAAGVDEPLYLSDNCNVECAYFELSETLIIINNSGQRQFARIKTKEGIMQAHLGSYETKIWKAGKEDE